tara:strand:- start:101 stop:472 length:372 start_codon:yes stop_codon:yes gene_type:complete
MKVEIYYNLHKNVFSVRHKGRVIQHTSMAVIKDAEYVVRPAGRAKVLREGKKNVHAFVRGEWVGVTRECSLRLFNKGKRVTYNPYKYSTFVEALTDEPIHASDLAVLWKEPNVKPKIGAYTHD